MIGDVSKKIGDIKDDLDDIDGVLTLKDEQIKHLQLAVVSAEMKQATSRQSWSHGRMSHGFCGYLCGKQNPNL